MQIPELVTVFNHQVGNTGWTGMRAYHDQALIDEFKRRGIDVSTVYDGKAISFAHPVRYDIADNRLTIVGCPCRLLLVKVEFYRKTQASKRKSSLICDVFGAFPCFFQLFFVFLPVSTKCWQRICWHQHQTR